MTKNDVKILLTKKLPKLLLPILTIGGVLAITFYLQEGSRNADEFYKKGGIEALTFDKGKYDSLMLVGLKVKYPNDYKIVTSEGNKSLGEYMLMKQFPQSQLIIGYEPIKNANGIIYNSMEDVLKRNMDVYEKFLRVEKRVNPKVSAIKNKKRGNFEIKYIETLYDNNSLYLYVLQTDTHIFRFTSDKKYFVENLISGIEKYEVNSTTAIPSKSSISDKIKIFNEIQIPLDEWQIDNEVSEPKLEFYGMSLMNGQQYMDFMTETHKHISSLEKYNEYSEERAVRQMKYKEVSLITVNNKKIQFNNIPAIQKHYRFKVNETEEEFDLITLIFKYNNWFYTISNNGRAESNSFVSRITLVK